MFKRSREELTLFLEDKGVGVTKEGGTSGAMVNETDSYLGMHKVRAFNGADE